jgi:hypothetical protein
MKWFELAKLLCRFVVAVVPGAAPLVPLILAGVTEAQAIHGADKPSEKQAHVLNLVANRRRGGDGDGKVVIDPTQATTITQSVFNAIDAVHAIVKAQPATSTAG